MGIIENLFRPIPAFLGVLVVIWLAVVFKHLKDRFQELDSQRSDLTLRVSELEIALKKMQKAEEQ